MDLRREAEAEPRRAQNSFFFPRLATTEALMKLTLILLTLLVLPGCSNLDRSTDARPYFNASTAVDITTTRYDKDLGKRPESFFHGVPNLLPTYGDRCSPNSGVKRHSHATDRGRTRGMTSSRT